MFEAAHKLNHCNFQVAFLRLIFSNSSQICVFCNLAIQILLVYLLFRITNSFLGQNYRYFVRQIPVHYIVILGVARNSRNFRGISSDISRSNFISNTSCFVVVLVLEHCKSAAHE